MSQLTRRTAMFARGPATHPELAIDASAQFRLADLKIDGVLPDPQNPRRHFDESALRELADSILANGLIQPIIVRPGEAGCHWIIAGERRWRAAKLAGLISIKAIIRPSLQDAAALLFSQIAENEAREPLTTRELVDAIACLSALGVAQKDIAARLGMAKARVAKIQALADLPLDLAACVETMGVDPLYELLQHHKRDQAAVRALLADEPAPSRAVIRRAFEKDLSPATVAEAGPEKVSPAKLFADEAATPNRNDLVPPLNQRSSQKPSRVMVRVRNSEHGEGRVVSSPDIVPGHLPVLFAGHEALIHIGLGELTIVSVD